MRNSLWLACILIGFMGSCEATLPSLDNLRCPTAPIMSTPDVPASGADPGLFGSFSKGNNFNCNKNEGICASLGMNFYCDTAQGCCNEAPMGRCNKPTDCMKNDKPVCDLPNNICVSCSGNSQCKDWATAQVDPLNRILCINGQCNECMDNSQCTRPGKGFCNQNTNVCGGCTANSDCPGSNICKLDESLLATGDTLSKIGECVLMADVVAVDNNPVKCDNAGAGGKPFCQISQAVSSGKSYIKVAGNGGIIANLYQPVTVSASGQRVTIIGPGRDVDYTNAQAVINGVTVTGGAQVTLIGISVTSNANQPAVQCSSSSTLYTQSILISDAIAIPKGGIYATMCAKVSVERTKVTGARGYGLFITGGTGHRVINSAFINSLSVTEQGGMRLSGGAAGLFAFNTIANNSLGVVCDSTVTITDSIVALNQAAPPLSANCQAVRTVTSGVDLNPAYTTGADPTLTANAMNDTCCVNKGLPDANMIVKEDYFSTKRPLSNAYDIGFHEAR